MWEVLIHGRTWAIARVDVKKLSSRFPGLVPTPRICKCIYHFVDLHIQVGPLYIYVYKRRFVAHGNTVRHMSTSDQPPPPPPSHTICGYIHARRFRKWIAGCVHPRGTSLQYLLNNYECNALGFPLSWDWPMQTSCDHIPPRQCILVHSMRVNSHVA